MLNSWSNYSTVQHAQGRIVEDSVLIWGSQEIPLSLSLAADPPVFHHGRPSLKGGDTVMIPGWRLLIFRGVKNSNTVGVFFSVRKKKGIHVHVCMHTIPVRKRESTKENRRLVDLGDSIGRLFEIPDSSRDSRF
jgi:hypothetical protein